MVSFFILPYEPIQWEESKSGLLIDPDQYKSSLMEKWPDARVYVPPSDSTYKICWEVLFDYGNGFSGGLQSDQQVISISPATLSDLNKFVIWHRKIIPKEYRLFLTWEGSWKSMELRLETTEDDIKGFTGLIE